MDTVSAQPWYRRAVRWGQTNITEADAANYDIAWWRDYWRRTQVQGVIINAGGIVAYYPSRDPLHYRAHYLGDRDLFGEVCAAAREEDLAVLARMDSNRATEEFYRQRPEWFARQADGSPYRAGERYVACIFTDYYDEFLTGVLTEIIERYHPDGFTDNSWSGLGRDAICHCDTCRTRFRDECGHELPAAADWDSPAYRAWIRWNYDRRLAVWDLNNQVTQAVGGPDCLWLGMNSGNIHHQAMRFRDHKAILERSKIVMLDHQRRGEWGFQQNGDTGKLAHGVAGWDVIMPESMAQYQNGVPTFRLGAKPAAEARHWMIEGFAGGIQPWWHFISAYHEDRRQYRTSVELMRWYAANQEYLIHRRPLTAVGVVWSQENMDFYGRDDDDDRVMAPYYGTMQALIRARIPYIPVHADHIDRAASDGLTVLVLSNLAAMSDAQVNQVTAFVAGGGSLVASGDVSRFTEWGDDRGDFSLAAVLGVHASGQITVDAGSPSDVLPAGWEVFERHTYLRVHPSVRGRVDGPLSGDEPAPDGPRHPVLAGFDETDILGFGGKLTAVTPAADVTVPLTYIPAFPIYPPEFAWMRDPDSGQPALVVRADPAGGRVAYLAADIDRLYARYKIPDHGDLLANLVRWAAGNTVPVLVEGPGLVDCHLYHQPGRVVLHLVNLSPAGHEPMEELFPVGPHRIAVRLPGDVNGAAAKALVRGESLPVQVTDGWAHVELPSLLDHEVLVIS